MAIFLVGVLGVFLLLGFRASRPTQQNAKPKLKIRFELDANNLDFLRLPFGKMTLFLVAAAIVLVLAVLLKLDCL